MKIIGKIEEIKDMFKGNGKRVGINGRFISVFEKDLEKIKLFEVGNFVEVEVSESADGKYLNLLEIKFSEPTETTLNQVRPSKVSEGEKIMKDCIEAIKRAYGVDKIEDFHVASVNSLFIYASKKW